MIVHLKESLLYILLFFFIFFAGFSDAAERPLRIGVTGGQTTIKTSNSQDYQIATHVGVTAQMDLIQKRSLYAGLEGKYTQTATSENVTNTTTSTTSLYTEETRSLYLSVRNSGDVYLRAKVGAVNRVIKTDTVILTDTTKPSAGLAVGFKHPQGHILEFDYTIYDVDTSVFSIGYLF
ncbi:MAG: outer membrane beta-barrel protein [Gammaproteobacteria bacterium]|nr:outer membrane beta-barrel protein [Gammaproteobacteria bacterium]MDH5652521.1 outer membrane beta-barrel protein [Gammaproteobacteria bacterium]